MPWTYYRAAREFGLRKTPALWVWALIAWTPSLFVIYHYIMMETLLLLLEGAALWMTARYLRKGGTEAFLTSIFFWTLASLTKPIVVPLAVVCVLWSWWKKSTPLRAIAAGALLAIIMLVPQAVRSKIETWLYCAVRQSVADAHHPCGQGRDDLFSLLLPHPMSVGTLKPAAPDDRIWYLPRQVVS